MSKPSPPPTIFLAFDIETTGQFYATNTMFGFGYVLARSETDIVDKGRFILDLRPLVAASPGKSWASTWETQGWEMRCWTEFWSKNVPILDAIMLMATHTSEAAMMKDINALLARYERDYEQTESMAIVVDTILFDTVWVSVLLQRHGHCDLKVKRDGTGYRSGYEVDSYRLGLTRLPATAPWAVQKMGKMENASLLIDSSNAHDPLVDALNISHAWHAASTRTVKSHAQIEAMAELLKIVPA